MRTLRLVAVVSLAAPAVASAESSSQAPQSSVVPDVQGWMISEGVGPARVRQVLPADAVTEPYAAGETQILYLNKNGTTLSPAQVNDSRANRSTLVSQTTAIPAWNASAATWSAIMSCTRTMWAPYNVTITDVDPGNVPHLEAIFTTNPSVIGMDPNVGGVSPYTIGCDVIPNSIVFTFAGLFGNDPESICEVMGQEMAHSYGLDHELLASDPMTYLQYNGLQAFRDQSASCGESQARNCGLQGECGANQNSHQMLMTLIGPGGGTPGDLAPTVSITSPAPNALVPPGFTVVAAAEDDGTVAKVELYVDGALAGTKTTGPFSFTTSASLPEGDHEIETLVYDNGGQTGSQIITVTVDNSAPEPDPDDDADGTGGDDGGGTQDPATLVGGCQAGGGQGRALLLALAIAGLVIRRRR